MTKVIQVALKPENRPATPLSPADLDAAFAALQSPGSAEGQRAAASVLTATLLRMLQERGEKMGEAELAQALQTLTGAAKLEDKLPAKLTADGFARDVVMLA